MATDVKLPRLGQGMESGTIVRWLKSEGETVKKREPLYELDTDKVTQEVEAEADGVLLKILVNEGEVEVGSTIAVIGKEGEEVAVERGRPPARLRSSRGGDGPRPPRSHLRPSRSREPAARAPAEPAPAPHGRRRASRRRRLRAGSPANGDSTLRRSPAPGRMGGSSPKTSSAQQAGVRSSAAAPPAEVEIVQLTSVRKTIARRLSEAWTAPVFQLGVSIDMTEACISASNSSPVLPRAR